MIVPLCGGTRAVVTALSAIFGRAFRGFRIMVMGSNSASGNMSVVDRGFRSPELEVVDRRGRNMDTTEGENMSRTGNR